MAQPPHAKIPVPSLLHSEEIIRAELRRIEIELTEFERVLRAMLAAPTATPAELPRWRKLQENLTTMIADPRHKSHRGFCATARKFIALDLTKIPATRD